MIAIIANHIVVGSKKSGNHTTIDRESCGEAKRFIFTHKLSKFLFQLNVEVERSIKEAATGTTGTIAAHSFYASFDDTFITC